MKIINLTKNEINVLSEEGELLIIPPEKNININIVKKKTFTASFRGKNISCLESKIRIIDKLPPKEDGTIYVVTSFVYYETFLDRDDFYIVGEPIKTESNFVKAARSLNRPLHSSVINRLLEIRELVRNIDVTNMSHEALDTLLEIKRKTNF